MRSSSFGAAVCSGDFARAGGERVDAEGVDGQRGEFLCDDAGEAEAEEVQHVAWSDGCACDRRRRTVCRQGAFSCPVRS